MLVLSRRVDESIVIDGNIEVMLLGIRGNQVRLGIAAPGRVAVMRKELLDRGPTPAPAADRSPGADLPSVVEPDSPSTTPSGQERPPVA